MASKSKKDKLKSLEELLEDSEIKKEALKKIIAKMNTNTKKHN
ncbi:hypothetical protein OS188_02395 [Xanthomarina sp. F1114]|nr:hypothetical protein [Xanthomarina sp. F1114]MCX7546797.1 hypothetical protein [Xanthomarina sp. F1114]